MPNEVSLLVSEGGLAALAEMDLGLKHQTSLNELLTRNAEGELSKDETHELDVLLRKIDELNLVKARASIALNEIASRDKN